MDSLFCKKDVIRIRKTEREETVKELFKDLKAYFEMFNAEIGYLIASHKPDLNESHEMWKKLEKKWGQDES